MAETFTPIPTANLANQTSVTQAIDQNFVMVQSLLNDVLSRSGSPPNQMGSNLDMNSNAIVNLPVPSTAQSPLRLIDLGSQTPSPSVLDGDNTYTGNNSFTGTVTFSSLPNLAALGSATYVAYTSQTTSFTLTNSHAGAVIPLAGSTFFTVTLNNPTGYESNFGTILVNTDSTRAKFINVFGYTTYTTGLGGFYLWPGQSVMMVICNGNWIPLGKTRWKAPTGTTTINVDPTSGSDTYGASDGLGTSSGAFKSIQNALVMLDNEVDFVALNSNSRFLIQLASGQTDTQMVHFSPHAGGLGTEGGAAIIIDGGGGTIAATPACIQLYYGAVMEIQNITLSSAGGICIDLQWFGKVFINSGVTFKNSNVAINLETGGHIEIDDNITVSGTMGTLVSNSHSMLNTGSIEITSTVTNYTNVVSCTAGGFCDFSAASWNFIAPNCTNAYNVSYNGVAWNVSVIPVASGPGTTSTGGQIT